MQTVMILRRFLQIAFCPSTTNADATGLKKTGDLVCWNRLLMCHLAISILLLGGCDNSKSRGVTGKIYRDPAADESYMVSGDIAESESPVVNANVYLSFDPKGLQRIKGSTAKTDSAGAYYIDIRTAPQPRDRSGCYYLIVEAEGYEFFSHPVRIGMMSSYQHNRVFLSPKSRQAGKRDK